MAEITLADIQGKITAVTSELEQIKLTCAQKQGHLDVLNAMKVYLEAEPEKEPASKKMGRPKGSKNKPKLVAKGKPNGSEELAEGK